jgi:hypothetical protein
MARSTLPTHFEIYKILLEHINAIAKKIPLQDFTTQGNSTNLKVLVKGLDELQTSMPYLELSFLDVEDRI